ncbi:MAG: hypothetical protein VX111_05690 [Planctomycetota bacterium]|nr:hypothetical protein [Planctomycetota bacterium]
MSVRRAYHQLANPEKSYPLGHSQLDIEKIEYTTAAHQPHQAAIAFPTGVLPHG